MKFINVSGDTQDLPTLDLRVGPGEDFDATGDDAKGLVGNTAFRSAGAKKTTPRKRTPRQRAAAPPTETPQTAADTDTKDVS